MQPGMFGFVHSRQFEMVAVIGTICAFSFSVGFVYPVIALSLEADGFDEAAIGINATASGLGVFVAGFLVPRMVRLYGTFGLLAGSVVLAIATLLLFPVLPDYTVWLILRFVLGIAVTALFAAGEAWINAIATEESRGRTMAIYVAAMASSFAIGSLAVTWTGYQGYVPFLTAGVLIALCFTPVLAFRKKDPLAEAEDLAEHGDLIMQVLRQAIVLLIVVALFGILDGVILGLLPSYALSEGVPDAEASLPLAAMALGVVLFQLPLGYLSDKMARTRLLTIILFLVVGAAAVVPHVDLTHWTGLTYMVVFGGLSFAPYTLALAILGERFTGRRLATGSALFAIMWGIGTTAGPLSFGPAMEYLGPAALPYGLALLFLITGAVSLLDRRPSPVRAKA
ncbi:MAG: MFS transporter [Alphaproteobacteria bacterium]|nr:MFS transporter [Alphaproteobacteria bacterium]